MAGEPNEPERLSPRERQVASLAAQGFTVTNMAARLEIAEPTVKTFLRRIYRKLGVSSRAQLACRLLLGPTAERERGDVADAVTALGAPAPGACCWNCRHYVRPRCCPEQLLEGPPVSVCVAGRRTELEEGDWHLAPGDRRVEPGDVCSGFEKVED